MGKACKSQQGDTDKLSTCMGLLQSRAEAGRSNGGDVGVLGLADNLVYVSKGVQLEGGDGSKLVHLKGWTEP